MNIGVLLIHANSDAMRKWLWGDVINSVGHYSDRYMPLYAICCVVAVFIICIVIDVLRKKVIEPPFFNWVDIRWEKASEVLKGKEDELFSQFNIM